MELRRIWSRQKLLPSSFGVHVIVIRSYLNLGVGWAVPTAFDYRLNSPLDKAPASIEHWIWLVPSAICVIFASHIILSMGYGAE